MGSYFQSFEGQHFGEELLNLGEEFLFENLRASSAVTLTMAAYAEFIARSASGQGLSGRCFAAEYWAYKNSFAPSAEQIEQARDLAIRLSKSPKLEQTFPGVANEIGSLLDKKPRKIRWTDPTINSRQLKKLVREDFGDVEFETDGAKLSVWGEWSIETVMKICHFPRIVQLSCGFDVGEPSGLEICCLKMLLLRYRSCLSNLFFDRPDDFPDVSRDPMKILSKVRLELKSLARLKRFSSQHLYINDDIVDALANQSLESFSVEPPELVKVTTASIDTLKKCDQLKGVVLLSKAIGEEDGRELLKVFPGLNLHVNGLMSGWDT